MTTTSSVCTVLGLPIHKYLTPSYYYCFVLMLSNKLFLLKIYVNNENRDLCTLIEELYVFCLFFVYSIHVYHFILFFTPCT